MDRMKKTLLVLSAALFVTSFHATSESQSNAYRAVRAGNVSGAELAIEGSIRAVRGSTFTWSMTLFEVVGLDTLRPAAKGTVTVVTAEQPDTPVIATTDKYGRATLTVPVPLDAKSNMGVMVKADTKSGVTRSFELNVVTQSPRRLWVNIPNFKPDVEQPLDVIGRLSDGPLGVPKTEVEVRLFDQRGPLTRFIKLETNADGIFHKRFEIPKDAIGKVVARARTKSLLGDDQYIEGMDSKALRPNKPASLLVHVRPQKWLVKTGDRIDVEVLVRRPDGRPVPMAVLKYPMTISRSRDDRTELRTDARGRATFQWQASRRTVTQFQDYPISVQAERTGIGSGNGNTTIRLAGATHSSAIAIENGALHPKIKSRVFARVLNIDGSAAGGGVSVSVSGPRIKESSAKTDNSGVAVFELSLTKQRKADRCGGEMSTLAKVTINGDNRGAREVCLSIDPDVSVKPSVPGKALAGSTLSVSLAKSPDARSYPVAVSLMEDNGGVLSVLSTQVVAANKSKAELKLPTDLRGLVFVRARAMVGKNTQESKGSLTAAWIQGADSFVLNGSLTSTRDTLSPRYNVAGGEGQTTFVVALPEDNARRVERDWATQGAQGVPELRSSIAAASSDLMAAALSTKIVHDTAASAVLSGRTLVETPAPQNPVALGLLRDPWRSKARFVSGRLALMFRAIENMVDSSVPNNTEQVAFTEKGKMKFNAQVLAAVQAGSALGAEGATGLGGDPLTIEKLRKLDKNFNYDNVAKRVTRRRLFRLMLALRQLVKNRSLDLDWARLGDPSLWLSQLNGTYIGDGSIQARDLADAWGRPFKLVKTNRPRFSRLVPVSGYELISMGPDGKEKTGDDMWDPTAQVLPSTSLYAKAVDEDALVARLNSVELGRATVQSGAGFFGANVGRIRPPPTQASNTRELWRMPSELYRDRFALSVRRPTLPTNPVSSINRSSKKQLEFDLLVDSEPRTWGVAAVGFSRSGISGTSVHMARAGSDFLINSDWPNRLKVGETLSVPIHVTNTVETEKKVSLSTFSTIGVSALENQQSAASGSTKVSLSSQSASIPAGESKMIIASVTATAAGQESIAVSAQDGQQVFWSRDYDVRADNGNHPMRRLATGLINGTFQTNLGSGSGSTSRILVLTPKTLSLDPDLVDVRINDPAMLGWSQVMSGLTLSPGLRADLLRKRNGSQVAGDFSPLSTALASVVWASSDDDEELQAFSSLPSRFSGAYPDADVVAGQTRAGATIVTALAGVGRNDRNEPWLRALRSTLSTRPEEPALLARAAAALLVSDPRDGHGRAMLAKALKQIEKHESGMMVKASEERTDILDRVSGSFALALAAHQVGKKKVAKRLLTGAMSEASAVTKAGGEPLFWMLAAGAYGAFGSSADSATVTASGKKQELNLAQGYASVSFDGGRVSVVTKGAAYVRAESVYATEFRAIESESFAIKIDGDIGRAESNAAFELTVTAVEKSLAPEVLVQVPAATNIDTRLLSLLPNNQSILSVSERTPGYLLMKMRPLAKGEAVRISLPLRWVAFGSSTGLAVEVHDQGSPHRLTVLPPASWSIKKPLP